MDIIKQENGAVLFVRNGTVLQNLRACSSIEYAKGGDKYTISDNTKKNTFGFNFSTVENTQVLPNAAVPFTGTREELFTLLKIDFFDCYMGGSSAPFDPKSVGNGLSLKLWFDAQDNDTITTNVSEEVTQWDDKSDTGSHATNIIGIKPTLDQIEFGGKQSLFFDDAYLDHSLSDFALANYSYFVVMVVKSAPTAVAFFHSGSIVTGSTAIGFYSQRTSPTVQGIGVVSVIPNPSGDFLSSSEAPTVENESSIRMVHNDSVWKNGVEGTSPLSDIPVVGTGISRIGGRPNQFLQDFHGNIGEILAYDERLNIGDRQQIEGYLAWKWGLESQLPIGHPYKNSPPI